MKKGIKIAAKVFAAILLLLLLLLFLLQIPRVQTWIGNRVADTLGERIGGEISVGSIEFRPVSAVILKDVLILDKTPVLDTAGTGLPVVDTFVRAGFIAATLSFRSLFSDGGVQIRKAVIRDAEFNLTIEDAPDGKTTTNLTRIFRIPPSKQASKDSGDLFEIEKATVENFTFRMFNYPSTRKRLDAGKAAPSGAIDWNDLEINADGRVRNLRYSHNIMSGQADGLRIREKSGYAADLSGFARVGVGKTLIRDLKIKDAWSDLDVERLQMDYPNTKAFSDFIRSVHIHGDVRPSLLDMHSIRYFAPGLAGNTFRSEIQGALDGTVSDFRVDRVAFHDTGSQVSGTLSGRVTGLPDYRNMQTEFNLDETTMTADGLGKLIGEWAPKTRLDLSRFAKGKTFSVQAKGKGTLNNLHVTGDLSSASLGRLAADLDVLHMLDKSRDMRIKGTVRTTDLDAGALIGNDAVRQITMQTGVQATLAAGGPEMVIDSLKISRLNALGYDYTGIWAAGTYSNDAFDGRIVCNDPNLNFMFQGLFNLSKTTKNAAYQFYANVGYADLNALHIDKRGKSRVSFRTKADFIYVNKEDILGDINIAGLVLENEVGRHDIGNISILSHSNDEINRIRLNSSFADGTYLSSKSLLKMVNDIRNLTVDRELPALAAKPAEAWDGTPYDLSLQFHDSRDLLSFVMPGLYIADSTTVRLKVSGDGVMKGTVRSNRLAFGDKYAKHIKLDFSNEGQGIVGNFTSPEIRLGSVEFRENSGSVFAEDNRVGIGYNYRNGEEDNGAVYLSGDFARDEDGKLVLTAQAQPSSICYDGRTWLIHSDDIVLKDKDIRIGQLRAFCDDQTLLVDGGISPGNADTLSVKLEKFDLGIANSLIKKEMDIHGYATGKALLISPSKPQMGMLVNLVCDSTAIAGQPAGLIRLESSWNEAAKQFDLVARNELDGTANFDVRGGFKPSNRTLDLLADLKGFNLGYAAPVLRSVFSEMGGFMDGKLQVRGPLDNLTLSGEETSVRDGLLRVGFTNVAYHVNGPVSLTGDGVRFGNMTVTDGDRGTGTLSGGISFGKGFSHPALDIGIRMRDMLALDLSRGMNSTFFGTLYGTGGVNISGPFSKILIDVNARTTRIGDLHIPLGSNISNKSMDILTFKEPDQEVYIDPYDQMMQRLTAVRKTATDLDVKLRVQATPDVTAHVEIDAGNTLAGQGSGTIEIEARTGNELFTINGDYTLTSGDFKLSALGLVNRDFTLRSGSSIRFNGDIMDSDLNIDGLYVTKTSLANLLSDENAAATRRTVNCGIRITDKLRNPQVKFSIDVPDLDPTTQSLVASALNTEDNVQKQFVYLLIAGSFLPAEQSGIVNNSSSMLYSNVSSIMAGQLNNIFQKLDIPLDLGLNYQATEQGAELFDVALSTQLFNNRVIVNGTIGNRQYSSASNPDEVVGDLDIDVKLNRPGTLRLNLFSHSADKYTSYLDNSQRSGAGIAYQREFDSLTQFIKGIFTPRARQEERPAGPRSGNTVTLQIDSTGKAAVVNPNE